jgi:hypothetical protein
VRPPAPGGDGSDAPMRCAHANRHDYLGTRLKKAQPSDKQTLVEGHYSEVKKHPDKLKSRDVHIGQPAHERRIWRLLTAIIAFSSQSISEFHSVFIKHC